MPIWELHTRQGRLVLNVHCRTFLNVNCFMSSRTRGSNDPNELRDVVANLVSGMPLSRVPDDLHPRLLVPLSAAKNEAIVAGNTAQVKRIQAIMHELRLNPRKVKTSRASSRASSRAAAITQRTLAEEKQDDLDKTIDELLCGRSIDTIDDDILPKLISAMKDRKSIFIAQGDYRKTQQLEDLIQSGNSRYYEASYHSVQNSKLTNLRLQLLQAKSDLEAAEQFWREAKAQHDEEYTANLEAMEQQHRQQLEDYDNSFPEVLPANFRKLSVAVLQLREQEKHLVLSKRYEDAIPFRERADKLENEELESQRQKFLRAFNTQRQQLIETQDSQRRCFDKNWGRKLERFEKEKDHEVGVLKRTIANLESRIRNIEEETEVKTVTASGRVTPRVTSRTTQASSRGGPRMSPASINPRVRNVAASRMTQKRCVVRRVGRD